MGNILINIVYFLAKNSLKKIFYGLFIKLNLDEYLVFKLNRIHISQLNHINIFIGIFNGHFIIQI